MPKSLQKFQTFLSNHNIFIKHVVCDKDSLIFMIVFSEELQEHMIVTINDEYKMKKEDIDINVDTISVFPFSLYEEEEKKDINMYMSKTKFDDNMTDDTQIIKDGLSMNNYKEIVIAKESTTDRSQYIQNTNQLDKFKECVKNLKYKLSIFSQDYISFIDRKNDIKNYIIKNRENYLPIENVVLCICIDLENLFECIDNFVEDSIKLYSSFYGILDTAHGKQIMALDSQLKLISDIPKQISVKKNDLSKIQTNLNKILSSLLALYKDEMKIIKLRDMEERKRTIEANLQKQKEISIDKYNKELQKIKEQKNKYQNHLSSIRKNYHSHLLSFDYNVYKGLQLFNSMSENMKKVL
jgi:hypothetical protein